MSQRVASEPLGVRSEPAALRPVIGPLCMVRRGRVPLPRVGLRLRRFAPWVARPRALRRACLHDPRRRHGRGAALQTRAGSASVSLAWPRCACGDAGAWRCLPRAARLSQAWLRVGRSPGGCIAFLYNFFPAWRRWISTRTIRSFLGICAWFATSCGVPTSLVFTAVCAILFHDRPRRPCPSSCEPHCKCDLEQMASVGVVFRREVPYATLWGYTGAGGKNWIHVTRWLCSPVAWCRHHEDCSVAHDTWLDAKAQSIALSNPGF